MVVRVLVLSLSMLGLAACEGKMVVRLISSDAVIIPPLTSEVTLPKI